MLHLQVFGSAAYTNIPKEICGGKLEATTVKCCLLGWWSDETKGYRLKDIEMRNLITSHDICFIEDEMPKDLATVKANEPPSHPEPTEGGGNYQ